MEMDKHGICYRYYPTRDGVGCAMTFPNGHEERAEVSYAEVMPEALGAETEIVGAETLRELLAHNASHLGLTDALVDDDDDGAEEEVGRLFGKKARRRRRRRRRRWKRKLKRGFKKAGRALKKGARKVKQVAKKVAKSKVVQAVGKVVTNPAVLDAVSAMGPWGQGIASGIRSAQSVSKLVKQAKKGSKKAKAALDIIKAGSELREAVKRAPKGFKARAAKRGLGKLKRTAKRAKRAGVPPAAIATAANLPRAQFKKAVKRGAAVKAARAKGKRLYAVTSPSGRQFTVPV